MADFQELAVGHDGVPVSYTHLDVYKRQLTALMGMTGVAAATEGYLLTKMNPIIRVISLVGGLMLIIPGAQTDIILSLIPI